MNRQKVFSIIITSIFILSVAYFLYQRYVPVKSNISDKEAAQNMKSIDDKYNTNEIVVVFKETVTRKKIDQIISEYNGEIVDAMPDINNYKVKINQKMSIEEILYLVEELNKMKEVSMAVLNEKVRDKYNGKSEQTENDKTFDNALSIYKKAANVYYAQDGTHSFLYPSEWDIPKQGKLIEEKTKKELNYTLKQSQNSLFEESIQNYIYNEKQQGFLLDSEMDQYEHNGLMVAKWVMKKDDALYPRAIIQCKDYYYYFVPNEKVSLDEFSLIVDSFVINKNPIEN